jgi:hypothetical protein
MWAYPQPFLCTLVASYILHAYMRKRPSVRLAEAGLVAPEDAAAAAAATMGVAGAAGVRVLGRRVRGRGLAPLYEARSSVSAPRVAPAGVRARSSRAAAGDRAGVARIPAPVDGDARVRCACHVPLPQVSVPAPRRPPLRGKGGRGGGSHRDRRGGAPPRGLVGELLGALLPLTQGRHLVHGLAGPRHIQRVQQQRRALNRALISPILISNTPPPAPPAPPAVCAHGHGPT